VLSVFEIIPFLTESAVDLDERTEMWIVELQQGYSYYAAAVRASVSLAVFLTSNPETKSNKPCNSANQ
jgi:hypothetical protein